MKQYISVKADINDADFVTEINEISNEDIFIIEEVIKKLLPYRSTKRWDKGIPYSTQEMEREESSADHYINEGILTKKECDVLYEYLPTGDENYSGIHTISEVTIFEKIKDLL